MPLLASRAVGPSDSHAVSYGLEILIYCTWLVTVVLRPLQTHSPPPARPSVPTGRRVWNTVQSPPSRTGFDGLPHSEPHVPDRSGLWWRKGASFIH